MCGINLTRGGGNITFYPCEEVVRFINRYIRKRRGIENFEDILEIDNKEWNNFRSLDLGCGIGRHIRLLDEFNLNPYGIDLSETAIEFAKIWLRNLQNNDISTKLHVSSVTSLPFNDQFFHICISEGVLDSMPRNIAKKGIQEVHRVLKTNGLFYLSLIMDINRNDEDIVVTEGYEKGTIQSYFTEHGIEAFLQENFHIVEMKVISIEGYYKRNLEIKRLNENLFINHIDDDICMSTSKRAHIVAKKKS